MKRILILAVVLVFVSACAAAQKKSVACEQAAVAERKCNAEQVKALSPLTSPEGKAWAAKTCEERSEELGNTLEKNAVEMQKDNVEMNRLFAKDDQMYKRLLDDYNALVDKYNQLANRANVPVYIPTASYPSLLDVPSLNPAPPLHCVSEQIGKETYTNCY